MITKTMVSVQIDYSNDTLTILEEFDALKDMALHTIDDETNVEQLDIWYKSTIYSDKMISDVQEWVKVPGMPWMKKPSNAVSERYKGLQMTLDNSTYCQVERDENGIITGFDESVDNEHLNEDGTIKEGWFQTFSLFKQYTNIINLMYSTMSKR